VYDALFVPLKKKYLDKYPPGPFGEDSRSVIRPTGCLMKFKQISPDVYMPMVNLGFSHPSAYQMFFHQGGRGIDTAFDYQLNGRDYQKDVGRSIARSGIPRGDFFVTSKVPCCPFHEDPELSKPKELKESPQQNSHGCTLLGETHTTESGVREALDWDLAALNTTYVDLLLLHWPCDTIEGTILAYQLLERALKQGKARAIGVSNFNSTMLEALLARTSVLPAVNQCGFSILANQSHWGRDRTTLLYCRSHGITYAAYSPLGRSTMHGTQHILAHPNVVEVATRLKKTTAQIALRWLVQQDIILVTASASGNAIHLAQDMNIFDFKLSAFEMRFLSRPPNPSPPDLNPSPTPKDIVTPTTVCAALPTTLSVLLFVILLKRPTALPIL
jgi:diketogulonate reductase-like aldo/keto reductase